MRNQYDNRDCLEMGNSAEYWFADTAKHKRFKVREASKEENINDHIDLWLERDEQTYSVDVKAAKRISRADDKLDYDKIWVEIQSVRADNRGWLFDGKADFIAFEQLSCFLVLKREKLIDIVKEKVQKVFVDSSKDALHKLYTRKGRTDCLTLLEVKDIYEHCKVWSSRKALKIKT